MKRSLRFLLWFVAVFALASAASADIVGFDVQLRYLGSYNSGGTSVGLLPNTTSLLGDRSTQTTVNLYGSAGVTHWFEMYIVTHLPASVDGHYFSCSKVLTGGVTTSSYASSAYANTPVSLPAMGPAGNQSWLNGGAATAPWMANSMNTSGFTWMLQSNFDMTGAPAAGNGTHGDMAYYLQVGELAPYDIGVVKLSTAGGVGTFTMRDNGGANFGAITNNDLGMGSYGYPPSSGNDIYVKNSYTLTQAFDSVVFVNTQVPEPSSLALLGCGLFGLLAYAWKKRK
jgi:hypothetical protein